MKSKEPSRRPDYRVSALSKKTEYRGGIGAAWINEDRSISVVLNPFVALDMRDDLLITLFPVDEKKMADAMLKAREASHD